MNILHKRNSFSKASGGQCPTSVFAYLRTDGFERSLEIRTTDVVDARLDEPEEQLNTNLDSICEVVDIYNT